MTSESDSAANFRSKRGVVERTAISCGKQLQVRNDDQKESAAFQECQWMIGTNYDKMNAKHSPIQTRSLAKYCLGKVIVHEVDWREPKACTGWMHLLEMRVQTLRPASCDPTDWSAKGLCKGSSSATRPTKAAS